MKNKTMLRKKRGLFVIRMHVFCCPNAMKMWKQTCIIGLAMETLWKLNSVSGTQLNLFLKEVTRMSGSNDSAKKRLEAERDQLLVEVARLNNLHDEHLGTGNHPADDATEVFEQAKNSALSRNLEGLLRQVEEALRRIDRRVYGLCKRCGKEIDPARLEALASATHCIECQEHVEQATRWRFRRAA